MAATPGNDEQSRLWNGPAGQAWVEAQQILDRMFLPFERMLAEAAAAARATRVLDVGCVTGATTLAIARSLVHGDEVPFTAACWSLGAQA